MLNPDTTPQVMPLLAILQKLEGGQAAIGDIFTTPDERMKFEVLSPDILRVSLGNASRDMQLTKPPIKVTYPSGESQVYSFRKSERKAD